MEASDFYNRLCPEISIKSFDDKEINLSDLRGNVIIIKFSKFAQTELPNLIFMEHIVEKYRTYGVSLIFINSSGRHDYETISKSCYFDNPIVEDDGLISGYFNADTEDTIIIDRKFYIKFKHHLFNKTFILKAFKKWAFEETIPTEDTSKEDLKSILQRVTYQDVLRDRETYLLNSNIRKKQIITLFISQCLGCRENTRIYLLKKVASQIDQKTTNITLLFGRGNRADAIREFAVSKGLDRLPMTIGVIGEFGHIHKDDYYDLFDLAVDPRTFVLNEKGKILFVESTKNSKLMGKYLSRRK